MESTFVEIDGLKLSYQKQGAAPKTIVLIHGNSGCKDVFVKQFQHFRTSQYSLLAIDLPGHGGSDNAVSPETTYTMPDYARIIQQALMKLEIKDYILVGWSLGGNIALEIAGADTENPNPNFKGIMIFGAPPVGPGMDNVEKAYLPATFESAVGDADTPSDQIDAFVEAIYGTLTPIPKAFYQCARRTEGIARETMVNHWFSGVSGFKQIDTVANWPKPICVLHGMLDPFVALEYLQTAPWENLWQNKIWELPMSGHAPFLEDEQAFNSVLESFAADVL